MTTKMFGSPIPRREDPRLLTGGGRYVDDALNRTTDNVHAIADVMVAHAVGSMHMWLNLTLTVGGGMVIIGVIVSLLSGLGGSRQDEVPATRKR